MYFCKRARGGEDERFSRRYRGPADLTEASQRWRRWAGEGDSRRNVGEDLQDRVFLFAGGVVVDVFCEMVHCEREEGGGGGGGGGGDVGGGGVNIVVGGQQSRTQTLTHGSTTSHLSPPTSLPPNPLQTPSPPPLSPNLPPLAFRYPFLCARSFSRRISAFLPAMTVVDTDSEAPAKKRKLLGREFYESIGSPTTIVAPMVEQSEYVCGPLALTSSRITY